MQKRSFIGVFTFLLMLKAASQINVGGFIKDKADQAKNKIKEKTTDSWEKNQKEYDASNFNYAISDINEDVYKTGYFGGIRLDGMFKKKHEYSLSFNLNKISTGANYTATSSLTPVVGSFSPFKAEDHFFIMSIAAHYKKLIPYGDLQKFKFYIVGGPSVDARLSKTSLDNQVTNAYKRIGIKGDLGLEFNNRSLYTMFFHYQYNIGSLTKSPIKNNINSFQLGIMVKATDLL